jgi:hypothetical protein
MNYAKSIYKLGCACGANHFSLVGQPVMRAVCHCHYCQAYNQAPYGDFLVYRASQLETEHVGSSVFKSYSGSKMVMRGSCTCCEKPILERASIPLFPKLLFVPATNHPEDSNLPVPALQMFTHRRVENPGDHIPAFSGYFGSEVPFVWKLMRSLYREGKLS